MPDHPLTLDRETTASNPGKARVSVWRWTLHYPKQPVLLLLALIAATAGCYWVSLWFLPLLLPVATLNVHYWIRIREHFRFGDTNPGLVIALNPTLVAVATDLTHGVGSYPAVKVFKTNLSRIMGEKPALGARLATVALYSRSSDPNCPHWSDFDPRPLECATSDQNDINRAMASFSDFDWQRLENAIRQIPSSEPGLYLLSGENAPRRDSSTLVFAKIMDGVSPMERRLRYSDPLEKSLQELGYGSVTGGGTLLSGEGDTKWVGLDIELVNLDAGLEFVRLRLKELGAPQGSIIEYRAGDQKISIDVHEP